MATKQINFRIDAELEQEIRQRAEAEGISLGQWFQRCARECLGKEDTTSDSNSTPIADDSNSASTQETFFQYELDTHQEKLIDHGEQLDELNHKVQLLENTYQRAMGMIEELYSASNSNSTPIVSDSKDDSSNPDFTITPSTALSGRKLAELLGTTETTLRRHRDKGIENFREWTQSLDLNGTAWTYDPASKTYSPIVEEGGDQHDCKADRKPSGDEHPISSDGKSLSEHQENAPSVEPLEKYPNQIPWNGSPSNGVSHKA